MQDYDWEDDEDIDMGSDDPWDDDAVMDKNEDMNADNRCEFGKFFNEETGACQLIEDGGYTDEEFDFGDDFENDEFIEDELDDLGEEFSEEDLEEV